LGTGKTDFGIQTDLAYRLKNGVSFTTVLGRQFYGKTSTLPLMDGNYAIVGVGLPLTNSLFMNITTSHRDELIAGTQKRKENALSAVYALDQTSALQFGYTRGRTTASPDDVISFSYVSQVE